MGPISVWIIHTEKSQFGTPQPPAAPVPGPLAAVNPDLHTYSKSRTSSGLSRASRSSKDQGGNRTLEIGLSRRAPLTGTRT